MIKEMRNKILAGLTLILFSSSTINASSLKVTIYASSKTKLYSNNDLSSTIVYSGSIYKGYYKFEIPDIFIDDTVLQSDFGVGSTAFVYSKNAKLSGKPSWCFQTSFYNFGTTVKTVKVSATAMKKGNGYFYSGTGNKGDHDLDVKCRMLLYIK